MKNLDLRESNLKEKIFRYGTYKISRGDESYSYFQSEFKDIEKDSDGNYYIVKKEENHFKGLLEDIKNFLLSDQEVYFVPKSSEARMYFVQEYGRRGYSEDNYGNILFPSGGSVLKR